MARLTIGACQAAEILGDVDAAIGVIQDCADAAVDAGLLVFPECFLQGYLVTEDHVRSQAFEVSSPGFAAVLARLAAVRQMLVLGVIERSRGRFFNTALVIAGGRVLGGYREDVPDRGRVGGHPRRRLPGLHLWRRAVRDQHLRCTRFPQAAAAVAAAGAEVLLVPAQNMMRREKAMWWQDRHNEIRAQRARENGMWLMSADVTGERDGTRIGLGPTCVINPAGQVVAQVPAGATGMAVAQVGR